MTRDILAGTVLTLKAALHGGTPREAIPTFVILQDGKEIHRGPATVPHGFRPGESATFRYEVDPERFPRGVPNYRLEYLMEVDGRQYRANHDYRVWPSSIQFRAMDGSGHPMTGFPVLVTNDLGRSVEYQTTPDGSARIATTHPGIHTLAAAPPHDILLWSAGKTDGVDREAVVAFKSPAAFFSPRRLPGNRSYSWFVNCPPAPADPPAGRGAGRRVEIVVGCRDDVKPAPGIALSGKPGDRVYVRLRFDRISGRTAPPGRVEGLELSKTLEKGDLVTGFVTLGDTRTARFVVDLGPAGGDRCRIDIGSTSECVDQQLRLVNWRKLSVQETRTPGCSLDIRGLASLLQPCFIEPDRETPDILPSRFPVDGLRVPADRLGETGRDRWVVGRHNLDRFHGRFTDPNTPHGIHLVICDAIHHVEDSVTRAEFTVLPGDTCTWDGETPVPGGGIRLGPGLFPEIGGCGVVRAQWRTDPQTAGEVAESFVRYGTGEHRETVFIRLPDKPARILAGGEPVTVEIHFRAARGPFRLSVDPRERRRMILAPEHGDSPLIDIAHEIGHLLSAVDGPAPPGVEPHRRPYRNNGHPGIHCAGGMTDEDYSEGAGRRGTVTHGNFRDRDECSCIMYGSAGSANDAFCPSCVRILRAADLTKRLGVSR